MEIMHAAVDSRGVSMSIYFKIQHHKHVIVTSWHTKLFGFRWRSNPSEKSTSTCTCTLSSSSFSAPSSHSTSSSVSLLTISISKKERWVLTTLMSGLDLLVFASNSVSVQDGYNLVATHKNYTFQICYIFHSWGKIQHKDIFWKY